KPAKRVGGRSTNLDYIYRTTICQTVFRSEQWARHCSSREILPGIGAVRICSTSPLALQCTHFRRAPIKSFNTENTEKSHGDHENGWGFRGSRRAFLYPPC